VIDSSFNFNLLLAGGRAFGHEGRGGQGGHEVQGSRGGIDDDFRGGFGEELRGSPQMYNQIGWGTHLGNQHESHHDRPDMRGMGQYG
jgi:hypothetical protein